MRASYKITIFIILIFSSFCVHAQPFLWKVTGEHEFYMFGTIHLPDPRITILSKQIDQALKESHAFYAELDLSEANTMLIKQSMWLPEKNTLYDYLSEDLENNISDYLSSVNDELNLEFFAKQKIWVLAITLTVLEQQLKYPTHPPLDTVLYNRANSFGLETGGLETVEEQLNVFESMSIDDQLIFLKDTVEFMKSAKDNKRDFVEESINAYINGDLNILMQQLMSYMKDNAFYDDLLGRLINQRNFKMADKMLSLVSASPDKKFFFAVGAGHFWGDLGILSILEKQGYSINTIE